MAEKTKNKHWSDSLVIVFVAVAIVINRVLGWGMIGGLILAGLAGGLGVLVAALIKGELSKKKDNK